MTSALRRKMQNLRPDVRHENFEPEDSTSVCLQTTLLGSSFFFNDAIVLYTQFFFIRTDFLSFCPDKKIGCTIK